MVTISGGFLRLGASGTFSTPVILSVDSISAEKVPKHHGTSVSRVPAVAPGDLDVLYQDESMVAIAKPAGLSVHRGWDQGGVYALQWVRDQLGHRVYPVHRLDRPTSGVLLFALSSGVAARLQGQFESGEVEKTYLTLVRGLPPGSGTIDHPVPRSKDRSERVEAVTDFVRLGTFERYALLAVKPRTGRLHQIRRHMKHRSWHIIGDVNYGKGDHNRLFRRRFGLHRLALHALELRLHHPSHGRSWEIRAPLPDDLAGPLRSMGFNRAQLSGRPESSGSSAHEP